MLPRAAPNRSLMKIFQPVIPVLALPALVCITPPSSSNAASASSKYFLSLAAFVTYGSLSALLMPHQTAAKALDICLGGSSLYKARLSVKKCIRALCCFAVVFVMYCSFSASLMPRQTPPKALKTCIGGSSLYKARFSATKCIQALRARLVSSSATNASSRLKFAAFVMYGSFSASLMLCQLAPNVFITSPNLGRRGHTGVTTCNRICEKFDTKATTPTTTAMRRHVCWR
mmetsp:Transcript_3023/g.5711  ORF Transcript_3023/g.5711 Transcript_3023/m.5711 type:complete len:230 (+) Transcript_3023:601-1290(+)